MPILEIERLPPNTAFASVANSKALSDLSNTMSAEAPVSVTSPVKVVSPSSSIVYTVFVVLPPEPLFFGSPKVIVPLKLLAPFSVSFMKPMASGVPECPKPKFNIAVFAVLESCVEASIKRVEEVPPDTVTPVEVVASFAALS